MWRQQKKMDYVFFQLWLSKKCVFEICRAIIFEQNKEREDFPGKTNRENLQKKRNSGRLVWELWEKNTPTKPKEKDFI